MSKEQKHTPETLAELIEVQFNEWDQLAEQGEHRCSKSRRKWIAEKLTAFCKDSQAPLLPELVEAANTTLEDLDQIYRDYELSGLVDLKETINAIYQKLKVVTAKYKG